MSRKGMEKMNFQECLNNYIIQIRCNGKELARNSEISETVISRYRKGERTPYADSEYLKKLSDGIIKTAVEKGIRDFKADKVLQTLRESLEDNRDEPAFNSQKLDKGNRIYPTTDTSNKLYPRNKGTGFCSLRI